MTPQLQQAIRLLQLLSSIDLQQEIQMLKNNPMLEAAMKKRSIKRKFCGDSNGEKISQEKAT